MTQEQRRTKRKPLHLRAAVACADDAINSDPIPVNTLDLSAKGALIESAEPLFENQVCTFRLTTSDARAVQVEGRIAWVKLREQGMYHAGVAFRNLSADEEYALALQMVRG